MPFRFVNLPRVAALGGGQRVPVPSISAGFCRKSARRLGVPFVLLDIIQTQRPFFASCLAFCHSPPDNSPKYDTPRRPGRWWLPPAGWSRHGTGAPAAAGGPRWSAVQPGTLAAGRLSFPPLAAALFFRLWSPAGGCRSALVFSCFGCPAGVFGARFCSAGGGCI